MGSPSPHLISPGVCLYIECMPEWLRLENFPKNEVLFPGPDSEGSLWGQIQVELVMGVGYLPYL